MEAITRPCPTCGEHFEARSPRALYCSRRCRDMARRTVPCARCGGPTWQGKGSLGQGQSVCRACRRARGSRSNGSTVAATCMVCGEHFEYVKAGGTGPKTCGPVCRAKRQRAANAAPRPTRPCIGCGVLVADGRALRCDRCREEERRAYWQAKNRRRRASKRNGRSEPYTLAEIAERDRYRCQLCRRKVDMGLKAPHRGSPTIDHVIPIVEGGDDVRANVQLAHRGCNSSKGRRGSQQLALVG